MYLVDKYYENNFYQTKTFDFYFNNLNIGVLDIETTGLNPERDKIILGGLVTPVQTGIRARQLFLESPEEEPLLLNKYLSEIEDLDVIFSYNGDNFDLPFINRRLKKNNLTLQDRIYDTNYFRTHQSYDLYRIIDRYSTLRKLLPNLKQKTVEAFMGLWSERADEISGGESVELYYEYMRTNRTAIRDIILLHNSDDILQLSRLIHIFDKLDLHKIMFHLGFIVSNSNKKLYIKKIELKKEHLYVTGLHKNIDMDYRHYGFGHELKLSKYYGDFSLKIVLKKMNDLLYVDLDDFSIDCSILSKYPGFQNNFQKGYLIVRNNTEINYAETNHLLKIILIEILEQL